MPNPDDLDFLDEAENPAPEPKKKGKAKAAPAEPEVPEGYVKVRIEGGKLPRAETHEPGEDPRQLQDDEVVIVTRATAEKWEKAKAARITI